MNSLAYFVGYGYGSFVIVAASRLSEIRRRDLCETERRSRYGNNAGFRRVGIFRLARREKVKSN